MRPCQAVAARWMPAWLPSAVVWRRLRQPVCPTAERLVVQASRNRRTTAPILRERLHNPGNAVVCREAVNASLHADGHERGLSSYHLKRQLSFQGYSLTLPALEGLRRAA